MKRKERHQLKENELAEMIVSARTHSTRTGAG